MPTRFAGYSSPDAIEGREGGDTGTIASQTITVDGLAVHVTSAGDGDRLPVILLHGFGGNMENWALVQPALASDRRVVAIDLPGHGRSGKAVADGSFAGMAKLVATSSMRWASNGFTCSAIPTVAA